LPAASILVLAVSKGSLQSCSPQPSSQGAEGINVLNYAGSGRTFATTTQSSVETAAAKIALSVSHW
jgi:hypothetical protein